MTLLNTVDAVLLDIEGTTTPIDFVFGVLFPYVRDRVHPFLAVHGYEPAVQRDLAQLRQEYEVETRSPELPQWEGEEPVAAVPYIHYLMESDRKSTGLKSLQGKVWDQGYQEGTLRSQLFADVKPALERWQQADKQIYIYSSGSIQAQKLLFSNSDSGDLTPLLSGYFDTTMGSKKEAKSYERIAIKLGRSPQQILFISDVPAELKAAQAAGFRTLLSQRPGNPPQDAENFSVIDTFDGL